MSEHINLAPIAVPDHVPTYRAALDADWVPVPPSDEDLIQDRKRLDAAFERTVREQRAWDYIESVNQRTNIRIKRMLLGAMGFFLWALVLAALVG